MNIARAVPTYADQSKDCAGIPVKWAKEKSNGTQSHFCGGPEISAILSL
jgi:hypothetical protein